MDRPILFSGAMVRAILDGTKTQTRRVMRSQPPKYWQPWASESEPLDGMFTWDFCGQGENWDGCDCNRVTFCPYGKPGDRLWVRESWARFDPSGCIEPPPVVYKADADGDGHVAGYAFRWSPSIHMPRWASRITLEVVSVRVERVQSISEADAMAEGVDMHGIGTSPQYDHTAVGRFETLWNAINAPRGYGWAATPFVWVVQFRKCGEG